MSTALADHAYDFAVSAHVSHETSLGFADHVVRALEWHKEAQVPLTLNLAEELSYYFRSAEDGGEDSEPDQVVSLETIGESVQILRIVA